MSATHPDAPSRSGCASCGAAVPAPHLSRRAALRGGAALAAGGAGALAAACGVEGMPGTSGPPRKALAPATVGFITWFAQLPDPHGIVFPRAQALFQEKFPQITVNSVIIPNGQIAERVRVMVAGGTPPDVVAVNPRVLTPLYSDGILAELDAYLKRDAREVKLDDFFPVPMQRVVQKGKHYALPLQMGLHVLAWNKALFGAAGVAPPNDNWTWDTYTDAARRMTKRDVELPSRQFGASQPSFEIPVWAWGGQILDPTEKKLMLAEPAAVAALEWYADLRLKHGVMPLPEDGQVPGEQQRFVAGQQAMWIAGTGFLGEVERLPSVPPWDLAALPKGPSKRATIVAGPSMTLIAASSQKDQGWEWLKHYMSPEVHRIAALEGKVVSTRRSAVDVFIQQPSPYNRRPLVDSATFAMNQPLVAKYEDMDKILSAALAAINSGAKSPRQAMQEAKPQVDALLAQG